MRLRSIKLMLLWLAALAIPAVARQAHTNASYSVAEIDLLPGGGSTSAVAINAGGSVAGTADTGNEIRHGDYITGANHNHALLWNNGRITDLPPPAGLLHAWGTAIDDDGRVAGYAVTDTGDGHAQAVVWKDGRPRVLPSLGGKYAAVRGLAGNAIAGVATLRTGAQRACLWKDSSVINLGTLNGGRASDAQAINRHGEIAGSSETAVWISPTTRGHYNHACVWMDRTIRDLGALGGRESAAAAINEKGQVCGAWWPGTFTSRAGSKNLDCRGFMFDGRKMHDLGTFGGRNSEAHGLDDNGRVVGEAETRRASDGTHAFLWSGGKMIDLNRLIPRNSGWILVAARSINRRGQIVGDGLHFGKPRAFVLTPSSRF